MPRNGWNLTSEVYNIKFNTNESMELIKKRAHESLTEETDFLCQTENLCKTLEKRRKLFKIWWKLLLHRKKNSTLQ